MAGSQTVELLFATTFDGGIFCYSVVQDLQIKEDLNPVKRSMAVVEQSHTSTPSISVERLKEGVSKSRSQVRELTDNSPRHESLQASSIVSSRNNSSV